MLWRLRDALRPDKSHFEANGRLGQGMRKPAKRILGTRFGLPYPPLVRAKSSTEAAYWRRKAMQAFDPPTRYAGLCSLKSARSLAKTWRGDLEISSISH
jgi:hypothetical protein